VAQSLRGPSDDDEAYEAGRGEALRRLRGVAASLESRLLELLFATVDSTPTRLRVIPSYSGLLRSVPIEEPSDARPDVVLRDVALAENGTAERVLEALARRLALFLRSCLDDRTAHRVHEEDECTLVVVPSNNGGVVYFEDVAGRAAKAIAFLRRTLFPHQDESLATLLARLEVESTLRAAVARLPSTGEAARLGLAPLRIPFARLSESTVESYVKERTAAFLERVRDIVLGDWHNYTVVEQGDVLDDDPPDEQRGLSDSRRDPVVAAVLADRSNAQSSKKQQLKVSDLARSFAAAESELLEDALAAANPPAALGLYRAARQGFELYRALFLLQHDATVSAVPSMTTVFTHDCLFLANAATDFSLRVCPKLAAKFRSSSSDGGDAVALPFFSFVDQVQPLRDLAASKSPSSFCRSFS